MSSLAVRLKDVCWERGRGRGRDGEMERGGGRREVVTNEEVQRGGVTERSLFVLTDNAACERIGSQERSFLPCSSGRTIFNKKPHCGADISA